MVFSIYKITNTVNNKHYIGFTENVKRRWIAHKSCNGSQSKALYRAIKKYGLSNFTFEVLYESLDKIHTLNEMEPLFIKEYDSFGPGGYNMNDGGGDSNSLEKRKAASERMKKHNPMSILRTNKGSFVKGDRPVITPERNAKISLSKRGPLNPNYGKAGNAKKLNCFLECPVCGKVTNLGNLARWHKHDTTSSL